MNSDLGRKTLRGVFWVLLTMGGGRIVQFVTLLILAKLLTPHDFGLVALGLILINFLVVFREMGLGAALIQRQDNLDVAYSSALLLFPLVGIVLYIVAFFLAPVAARFFNQAEVIPLIRILALSIPIAGAGILPETVIKKSLVFQRKFFPELFASAGYGVIAIVLASRGYGAYSIVYGQIASEAIRSLAYWIASPLRIRSRASFRVVKELLGFGQKVTAGSLSIYVFNNMDQFSIGKLLGDAALGFYSFAFRIANLPAINITHVINQVLLPTFSLIQSDRNRFRDSYLRVTGLIAAATIPLAAGFVLFGREGLGYLYGDKWIPAVAALQILAVYGMLRSVGATFGNVLIVSAKPEWLFYGALGQIVLAASALILGVANYGITGVAATMTVALIFGIVLNGVMVSRILRLGAGDWIRIVGVPLLLSLVFIGGVQLVLPGNSGTWLVVKICVAIGLYIAAAYLLYRQEIDGMIHEVGSMGKAWVTRTRRQ